jgi:hypothetical protein
VVAAVGSQNSLTAQTGSGDALMRVSENAGLQRLLIHWQIVQIIISIIGFLLFIFYASA